MPRLTRQERQAATRERLIEAATRVFARRGYLSASVEEIADEAGFSHGAVYSNFSGKEDLFLAAYAERIVRRQGEILAAHHRAATPAEQARAAADGWMERVRSDPEYFLLFLEFVLHAARNPDVGRRFAKQTSTTRRTIEALLEQRADETPIAPDRMALAIRALGLGLAIEHVLDTSEVPPDLYGEVVGLLLGDDAAG